jgi:catalase-peroxidase
MEKHGTGNGEIQIQADLKVLGPLPVTWSNYFENLFGFEWELTKVQLEHTIQTCYAGAGTVPDAHDPTNINLSCW